MSTVINLLKLVLLIIFSFSYLYGLGFILLKLLLKKETTTKLSNLFFQTISLNLVIGIVINFLLLLIFQNLKTGLFVGALFSIVGLFLNIQTLIKNKTILINKSNLSKLLVILCIIFIFFSPIMTKPLVDWDARSIWFLHAKMIFSNGSINNSAGWSSSIVSFSHPDYPKLIPSLAAQISYLAGYWNEYLPKLSLLLMLIPAILMIISFARMSISFIFLLLLIPFSFYPWIWNGYMDGLLAIYTSISILLLARYLMNSQFIDLISGSVFAIVLLYVKNEGIVATIAIIISLFLISLLNKKSVVSMEKIKISWNHFLFGFLHILPFIIWNVYKLNWGLTNDLGIGTTQSIQNIISRFMDGSIIQILSETYNQISGLISILGFLLIVLVIRKKALAHEVFFPLLSSLIILTGIFAVYTMTPNDLTWHLSTSVNRTMLPVNGGIIIAGYYLIRNIES